MMLGQLDGNLIGSSAEFFPISLIAANFQQVGTVEVDQHNWKRSKRVSVSDGHLLKIWYDTRSNGDGEDVAIDH